MLLYNQWVKEEISREKKKYFEMNENENKTHKNLQDAAKPVVGGGERGEIYSCKHLK